jgi:hypothetical protein
MIASPSSDELDSMCPSAAAGHVLKIARLEIEHGTQTNDWDCVAKGLDMLQPVEKLLLNVRPIMLGVPFKYLPEITNVNSKS